MNSRHVAIAVAVASASILIGIWWAYPPLTERFPQLSGYSAVFEQAAPMLAVLEIAGALVIWRARVPTTIAAGTVGFVVLAAILIGDAIIKLPVGRAARFEKYAAIQHPRAAEWGNGTAEDEINRTFMGVASLLEHAIEKKGAERKLQETVRRQQQSYENLRFSTPPPNYE